jgi:hypothetical protein
VRDRTFIDAPATDRARRLAGIAIVATVVVALAFLVRGVVAPGPAAPGAAQTGVDGRGAAVVPELRTIGADRIRAWIRDGKLSEREALFWKR